MALSSENSVSPSMPPSVDSRTTTSALHPESSVHAAIENALDAEMSEHQGSRQQEMESDVEVDIETVRTNEEDGNHSTNVREIGEEGNYADDEKGSGVETDSVEYGDEECEIRPDGACDGSVSPSYSSMRVEPDLEDSQSHLRLEEIFEGEGSGIDSEVDLANLAEPFAVSELELIERALQSLKDIQKHSKPEVPDTADGEEEGLEVDERGPPSPDYSRDVTGVSRLLKKVQAVSAQKKDALVTRRRSISRENNRSPRTRSMSTGDQDMDFADMRQLVQAASRAAFAAAETAAAVVNSVDRNSQAIQELCKTLGCPNTAAQDTEQKEGDRNEDSEETSELLKLQQDEIDIELQQAEVTRNLVRQNRLTHWALGFIIVTTFAWRFGMVQLIKKVNSAVSNPFQGITGVFDNFKTKEAKSAKEKKESGIKLPSILPDDSDDEKDGELPFNLGKLLSHKDTDAEIHASAHARARPSENSTDGPFNIGNVLHQRDASDDER